MDTLHTRTIPHPNPEYKDTLEVVFTALREEDHPASHFEDAEDINYVFLSYLHGTNNAAWFIAKVVVRPKDFDLASDAEYLGACSYKSFDEFCSPGDYFEDMVNAATKNLFVKLVGAVEAARKLGVK